MGTSREAHRDGPQQAAVAELPGCKINFTTDDGEAQAKNKLQTGFVRNFRNALERELELVNDTYMTEIMASLKDA